MPVECKKDEKGCYCQWGNQSKYYYNCNSEEQKELSYNKARKQGVAIEISNGGYESCDCGEHFNIKNIVFNDDITDDEKEKMVIGEIHKDAIVNYLESGIEIGVTIEELGINEEDLYNPKYYVIVDADEEVLNFNEITKEEFRIINLYKYVSNIYGPSNVGPNTRPFCRSLVNRTNLSLLRYQDITALNSLNPGFGKGGSNTYSVFNWRGGVNCKHVWLKYFFDNESMNLVEAPKNQQPKQTTVNGRVPYANGTNKPTKK